MLFKLRASLISVLFLALVAIASAQLAPGAKAPNIVTKEWVQGKPMNGKIGKGIYIVEFWATWCGPCRESIPHLNQIAKKNPDVRVIGVSIWEDNADQRVQKFVAEMGANMTYSVAYSGNKDGMAETWTAAAKQNGIPHAFLIKDGVIQWIGHPDDIEPELKSLKAGTFNLAKSKEQFAAQLKAEEEAMKIMRDVQKADELYTAGKQTEAHALADEIDKTTAGRAQTGDLRFKWLALEDNAAWKTEVLKRMDASKEEGSELAYFVVKNAVVLESSCRWLVAELTKKYPANWYPYFCAARMCLKLKDYDQGIAYSEQARQAVLAYQKANPTLPKGNALEMIQATEDAIKKAKGG